jgi:chromosome segregation ATPase
VTEQDRGGNDTMSDSEEFEKLGALEARLAAAMDRIAKGLAARSGETGGDARVLAAETAAREAEARASELSERVSALEARLSEAQEALARAESKLAESSSADEAALEKARAELAEREAERDAALAAQKALESRVAELEATAAVAPEPADPAELAVLKRRVERARAERDEAIEARDRAQDTADELAEAAGAAPDERVLALRSELRGLRGAVDRMSSGLDELRSVAMGAGDGAEGINRVLEAQVAALTEARKAEAAELGRILSELMAAEAVREEEARNA